MISLVVRYCARLPFDAYPKIARSPSRLIDITCLSLNKMSEGEAGGLRIGALVTNTDAAYPRNALDHLDDAVSLWVAPWR